MNATPRERPLVRLNRITKDYAAPSGVTRALHDVDLEVDKGEIVGVTGRSGSGKSTLLNVITGIDRPTTGEVWVAGTPVHTLSEGRLATWRGRTVGVVFQFFQLLPTLTVAENVMLPMDFCNVLRPRERRERAMALLNRVGIADQADKLPLALSGGQQQRAAIARALATDPPLVVADEPTGNLDSATGQAVWTLLGELASDGKAVVVVTHDQEVARYTRRTVRLCDGAIVSDARTPAPLEQDAANA